MQALSFPTAADVPALPEDGRRARVVAAAAAGNALEWFDLLIYGSFAVTIADVFFPTADAAASLLLALGTFGASYVVRPFDAVVLGAYGDRAGRKASGAADGGGRRGLRAVGLSGILAAHARALARDHGGRGRLAQPAEGRLQRRL